MAYLSFKKGKLEILWHTFLSRKVSYSEYPLGLFFCQFQLSRHISSIPRVACQPSISRAFVASAKHSAISPARRAVNLYGIFTPLAFSKEFIISRTLYPTLVPRLNTSSPSWLSIYLQRQHDLLQDRQHGYNRVRPCRPLWDNRYRKRKLL